MNQVIITLLFCVSLLFCSVVIAGEEKTIDSFDGLKSTKKDGVIIIDYTPTADREKMKRDDKINKIKRAKLKAKQDAEAARRRARIRAARSYKSSYKASSTSQGGSSQDRKNKASYNERINKRRLREVEREERNHVGSMKRWEMDRYNKQKEIYKGRIKDAQEHPEDY